MAQKVSVPAQNVCVCNLSVFVYAAENVNDLVIPWLIFYVASVPVRHYSKTVRPCDTALHENIGAVCTRCLLWQWA